MHCCHCLNCQRQTGSAFVVNILLETDLLQLLQADVVLVTVPRDAAGERTQDIARCRACGIAVYSQYTFPEFCFVRAGTLDDPAAVRPDVHIFTRSKLPWVSLPHDVPAFDVFYDMEKVWPAESLERFRAAMDS